MNKEELQAKLSALPDKPGSYQMKDKNGTIIYVGKAKSLKNRVRQYFVGAHDYKTTKMVSNIADFDWVVTNSEKEALVLENNLIKQYHPHFNISLMDDKTYPCIKLTNEKYPVLKIVRDRKKDRNAQYFGPYPDVLHARETIQLLNQIYPLRKCDKMGKKVCLYYHLGQCLGPCEFDVNTDEYNELCKKAVSFIKGDTHEIIKDLTKQREEYADKLEFEKAGDIQNLIDAINKTVSKQQVETSHKDQQDVWHIYSDKGYISISCLLVRDGKISKKVSELKPLYEEENEALISYISQYYMTHTPAKEVLIPKNWDIDEIIDDINFFKPIKGHKKSLIDLALTNAKEYHDRHFTIINKMNETSDEAMMQLSNIVGSDIHRIELFDNSHISGTNAVAGMVVYQDGLPSKKDYRKYKVENGADDLANMREVIYRRYFRVLKDNLVKPDMILVDGGYNQIRIAKEVIDSLYMDILVYGLVKDDKHNTANLMNSEGIVIDIPKDSSLFYTLCNMQDEVHRFAITYHRQLRSKSLTKSELTEVKGIGEKRRKELLKHFGSFTAIKQASFEQLLEVLPNEVAQNLYSELHKE